MNTVNVVKSHRAEIANIMENKTCHCGQKLKFHDGNSDEPITMDIEETEGSFWWCSSCGIQGVVNEKP